MLISITELIKKAFIIYFDNFKIILKYILLNIIPTLLSFVISFSIVYSAKLVGTFNSMILYILVPLFFVLFIAIFVISMWFNFALIKELQRIYQKIPTLGVKASLNETKHSIWNGILTSILTGLYSIWLLVASSVLLLVKLFILPNNLPKLIGSSLNVLIAISFVSGVIYLMVYGIKLAFSVFETILENKKAKEAINASKQLTKNRWWDVALRIIVPALLIYVSLGIINSISTGIGKMISDSAVLATDIINMLLNLLATPIGLIVGIILYQEIKKVSNTTETAEVQQ